MRGMEYHPYILLTLQMYKDEKLLQPFRTARPEYISSRILPRMNYEHCIYHSRIDSRREPNKC